MEEFARGQALKKEKWDLLTKMFYDPEGAAQHARQMERDKVRAGASDNARSNSPSAEKEGSGGNDEKYTALTPEYWKQPFLDLKDLHVIKNARVL